MSLRDRKDRHDVFFRKARSEGFAARSVYKLEEIDKKVGLLKPGLRVLDLGCRPGSWMQYAQRVVGSRGAVVALQRQPFPFDGGFETVARQRTRRHGAYDFHRTPGRATRYRVARRGSHTGRRLTAYVEPRFTKMRCNLFNLPAKYVAQYDHFAYLLWQRAE